MRISENRLRQILREEARRVLREDDKLNEGWFDQARNRIGAAFGENNPHSAAERFRKRVPAFMEAYEMYKKLKPEYGRFHRTDSGHSSMDAFGGFTPEMVQNAVRVMERVANRETDIKKFYQEVDSAIGPKKKWTDLDAALRGAAQLMSNPKPLKAVAEEYFNLSAKHRADMDAHDREMDAERARKADLDRFNRRDDDRGGGGGGGERRDFWRRGGDDDTGGGSDPDTRGAGRVHGVGGRHTGPLDPEAMGTLIGA